MDKIRSGFQREMEHTGNENISLQTNGEALLSIRCRCGDGCWMVFVHCLYGSKSYP